VKHAHLSAAPGWKLTSEEVFGRALLRRFEQGIGLLDQLLDQARPAESAASAVLLRSGDQMRTHQDQRNTNTQPVSEPIHVGPLVLESC
jgi:hypothetical protein